MLDPRRRVRVLVPLLLLAHASCGSDPGTPDGIPQTVCTDGVDNDGDGSIDFPAAPGCDDQLDTDEANSPIPACNDTRDNDADGKIDYPFDPGCISPLQNSEGDTCPTGDSCPRCGNGIDDDNDGRTDYPEDDGCFAAGDTDEYAIDPNACGAGITVTHLTSSTATGTLMGTPSNLSGSCGGSGGEIAYGIVIDQPTVLVATTDLPTTVADTVVYLRSTCSQPATELACNDDASQFDVVGSTITASLAPGVYYLIVDAASSGVSGPFTLEIDRYAGEGVECTDQSECGPGLQCRIPLGETVMVCAQPVCNDTVDDDGDGANDFPDDPGCDNPGDFDETDDCPAGENCPACANDIDDDSDGDVDYPDDVDCASASQAVEGCSTESDPILSQTGFSTSGTTVGATDDFFPSCVFGGGSPDVVTLVNLPAMQNFHADLSGTSFDSVLVMHDQTCDSEVACDDSFPAGAEVIDAPDLPAGIYALVVDGTFSSSGTYTLNISGTIAPFGACDGQLATAGVIACGDGYDCVGGICLGVLACNNGVDDDGDGEPGYPTDPGCDSPLDDDETDDCPNGANCPQCADEDDNDLDGQFDFPDDTNCLAASDDDEFAPECVGESDPFVDFLGPTITGTTTGNTDDFFLSCSFSTGPDIVAIADLPAMSFLHVDSVGTSFDMVLAVMDPTCGNELGCSDFFAGEVVELFDLDPAAYAIVVDGWNGNNGPYQINLSGTIAPLGACDGLLATAGAITCEPGYSCTGGQCLGSAQCNNGVDDDGDGHPGYPSDPGCTDPLDNTEADTCPNGASCPECGDNDDNDGDGLVDYPEDPSCIAASGDAEGICGHDTGGVTPIVIPLYMGDTFSAGNEFTPTCASAGPANDVAFSLDLPVAVQNLRIDTIGSTFDTVLSVLDSSCDGTVACDDQGGGGGFGASLVSMSNVPAGEYGVIVDGWIGNGDYMLSVRGTVAPGAACTDPLFATGVLVCPANHICTGGTCQPL
jgi:hypothetical protein